MAHLNSIIDLKREFPGG